MQTAAAAFGGGKWQEGDKAAQLMTEGSEQEEISAAHSAIAESEVPFVAFELCREHIGDSCSSLLSETAVSAVRQGTFTTLVCWLTAKDAASLHPLMQRFGTRWQMHCIRKRDSMHSSAQWMIG